MFEGVIEVVLEGVFESMIQLVAMERGEGGGRCHL